MCHEISSEDAMPALKLEVSTLRLLCGNKVSQTAGGGMHSKLSLDTSFVCDKAPLIADPLRV